MIGPAVLCCMYVMHLIVSCEVYMCSTNLFIMYIMFLMYKLRGGWVKANLAQGQDLENTEITCKRIFETLSLP